MPIIFVGLPRWLSGKEFTCQAGDAGLILSREGPLEKERATHSSILAWEIPWTEEPGGLQSAAAAAAKSLQSCPTVRPHRHHWDHCIFYLGRWAPGFWEQGRSSRFELLLTQVTALVVGADECRKWRAMCGLCHAIARTEDSGLPPSQADPHSSSRDPLPPVSYSHCVG